MILIFLVIDLRSKKYDHVRMSSTSCLLCVCGRRRQFQQLWKTVFANYVYRSTDDQMHVWRLYME